MRQYSRLQTAALVRRLGNQVDQAAHSADEEAVHDLRVSIRRLSRCLRVFAQFYPGSSWKKLRAQLHELMEAAGAVRDVDIAIGLLGEAGIPARTALLLRLAGERRKRGRRLASALRQWRSRKLRQWSRRLESPG
ncbi:MAG TPA: CHAD domain-containing protein [Verrucomicrobiae bacterium]|nr:CHAD domain-containing protein [Verrucomicrobiae bacterium]